MKHVIKGNSAGWGSQFLTVLAKTITCSINGEIPDVQWDSSCLCYNDGSIPNVWALFYEPFTTPPEKYDVPKFPYFLCDWTFKDPFCASYENRIIPGTIYNNYIKPAEKQYIKDIVSNFMNANGLVENEYEALHFRGTDWSTIHSPGNKLRSELCPLSWYVEEVRKIYDPNKKLFIMSDNHETINVLKENFTNVVFYDKATRATKYSGPSVHNSWNNPARGNHKLAEDMIIETSIASKAKALIHSEGNVGLVILNMNPNMESKLIRTIKNYNECNLS